MKQRVTIRNTDSGIWDSNNMCFLIWYTIVGEVNTGDGWHVKTSFGGSLNKLDALNKAEYFRKRLKAGKINF